MKVSKVVVRWLTCVTRSFPRLRGRYRICRWLALQDELLRSVGGVEVQVNNVGRLLVDPGEFIGRYCFIYGAYEPHLANICRAILREGDHFVDIGANIGFFSVLAGNACGPTGRVWSFEPSPTLFHRLEHNLQINRLTNVNPRCCAIGDKDGTVQFFTATSVNAGLGSIRDIGHSADQRIHVPIRMLDSLRDEMGRVRLIKIDVEGAEPLVMSGAKQILRDHAPYLNTAT